VQPKVSASQTHPKSHTEDIFKAYDIRGIVGKGLNKEIIYDIGLALGSEAKIKGVKTIVIARDGRTSSPDLVDGLIKGILSTGRDVLDLGMVPTPVLYFVTQHTEGRTGVMLTGSHNPANYNGLKMVMQGETLAMDKIQKLKQRIEDEDYITEEMGSVEHNTDYVEEYIGTICDDIHLDKNLKVVVDCGNGVAGQLAPELLRNLGCEVIELFCEVDGTFPNHHPDPSKPENLKDLIAAVASHQADIGLAIDGDGDRLGVIDNNGKIIWPDRQMMLYAKDVLSIKPGAEIIYDVKCSRHLKDQIRKYGGRGVMWKTGHSMMKAKLRETGAALAGEMSGHIFFNDRWFGFDDALYTAARLLEILAGDSHSSSELFAAFPDSVNTPEINIPLAEGENFDFMQTLLAKASFPDAEVSNIDGLRVDFKDGWGLVRASNTTPSLVVRFEGDDQKVLERIQQQFKKLMVDVKGDIQLPF
jgi:phosphomannomutase/phosphoglucomutase